jgi:hypothetical protein
MNSCWRMTACAAVALVTTALAGCGGGGTDAGPAPSASSADPSALSALRKAAKATEKAGSARFDGTSTTGGSTSIRQGALDWARNPTTGRLVVTGSGAGQTRCLKKAVYQQVTDTVAASLGGKHWLKYSYAAVANGTQLLSAAEPAGPVKELVSSGDVRTADSGTVRGVRTTHYLGTTDTERIDVWIDKHGLVIKSIRQDDGSAGSTTTTAYYSHYGTNVAVKAPPAADTVDYTALLNAQSASPSS